MSMLSRYSRAVRWTAPKIMASTPGSTVEGYWVSENQFFFLAERTDPELGRVTAFPSLADAESGRNADVVAPHTLSALLSEASGQPVDLEVLSRARFDMPTLNMLAVSLRGRDYLIDRLQQRVVRVTESWDVPALYSPDGRVACFLRDHNLWLRERASGIERPLTTEGVARNGFGEQSESLSGVSYALRPTPMALWSADSRWILTHRIDERSLPEMPLVQHAPPGGGRPIVHLFKYPMPGDPLPQATFVAIEVASGRVITFESLSAVVLGFSAFTYRMAWFSPDDTAWFLRFDRYCKCVDLVRLDLAKGSGEVVLSEGTDKGYLELNTLFVGTPNVRTLAKSNEVIWYSEQDGWGHLYLHDAATGRVKNRITSGKWLVRDIVHVDEARRRLLLLANGLDPANDPARRSLCAVNLDGTNFQVLLNHDGDIYVPATEPAGLGQDLPFRPPYAQTGVAPDGCFALVRYTSIDRGNRNDIVGLVQERSLTIATAVPGPDEVPARHFTAEAADGTSRLHGVMFVPPDFSEGKRYPLIDYIYPGPQVALQPQSFRAMNAALAMALAELGFVTIMFETRRMPFRSRALHQVGYGRLWEPQLSDHAAVVRQLCERYAFIDKERIGIMGQSGGGAASARALFDYGHIFKVGVAVCGDHDPSLYSALWSDRFRGEGSREGFADQANAAAAYKLKGKLLLISGDMDENVHMSQTLVLADALIRSNRDFDLLIVPNAAHNVLITSGYVQRRIWDYFVRNLLDEVPPSEFEIKFEPHELQGFDRRTLWRQFRQ